MSAVREPGLVDGAPADLDLRRQSLVADGGNFLLTIGSGKIVLWLGRKVPEATIGALLRAVAEADPRAGPREPLLVKCSHGEIPRYEEEGLRLLGHALAENRALFQVPFVDPRAVRFYTRHLAARREVEDVEETLLWKGGPLRLRRLAEALRALGVEFSARARSE
ncbi:MAG: hypothetical protein QXO51_03330 [Halobacteria archaeon]